MYIETYSSKTFSKARLFYVNHGFRKVGEIKDYERNGVNIVIYGKEL
jgi:ribosomal protein S18 acetylase RimI-like enzyme